MVQSCKPFASSRSGKASNRQDGDQQYASEGGCRIERLTDARVWLRRVRQIAARHLREMPLRRGAVHSAHRHRHSSRVRSVLLFVTTSCATHSDLAETTSGSRIRPPATLLVLLASFFLRESSDSGSKLSATYHNAPRCVSSASRHACCHSQTHTNALMFALPKRLTFCFNADHLQNLQVPQTPNVHANRLQTQSWRPHFALIPI